MLHLGRPLLRDVFCPAREEKKRRRGGELKYLRQRERERERRTAALIERERAAMLNVVITERPAL